MEGGDKGRRWRERDRNNQNNWGQKCKQEKLKNILEEN